MSIVLHIERLVIDEAVLGGEHAAGVRAATERELAGLLAHAGVMDVLRGVGTVAALPAALLPVATPAQPTLAPRIAAAVQHGLGLPSGAGREHLRVDVRQGMGRRS